VIAETEGERRTGERIRVWHALQWPFGKPCCDRLARLLVAGEVQVCGKFAATPPPAEGRMVRRLTAGGNRIRTIGPSWDWDRYAPVQPRGINSIASPGGSMHSDGLTQPERAQGGDYARTVTLPPKINLITLASPVDCRRCAGHQTRPKPMEEET
jgi:hypothetical protein